MWQQAFGDLGKRTEGGAAMIEHAGGFPEPRCAGTTKSDSGTAAR
jgi:hypothetical protein